MEKQYFVGIDIGSTSAKVSVLNKEKEICYKKVMPTGWSSIETAKAIEKTLEKEGINKGNSIFVATGYGRISVPYADKMVTEITCHGIGAAFIFGAKNSTVIDIGGQDTKIISLKNGEIVDFIMNDKCSAGTGRFLEIMANILGCTIGDMCKLAKEGKDANISSMCTVFAESEVISMIGSGRKKEDIAFGIVDSIGSKVKSLSSKHAKDGDMVYLTGGLCEIDYILKVLSKKLNANVQSSEMGRFAGSVGASIMAQRINDKRVDK